MQTILNFLKDLDENNNREWFEQNKNTYLEAKQRFESYVNILIPQIKDIDSSIDVMSAKDCTFRIYKDVRFSKDKNPYKNNMGAYFAHGGKKGGFAGYYLHIEPNNCFVGGGLYMPEPLILNAVRTDIYENIEQFESIINNSEFLKIYPEIKGEKLKTAPKGFPKDFPKIELLKYKSYTVFKSFSEKEIIADNFFENVLNNFEIQKPFNDFINEPILNLKN